MNITTPIEVKLDGARTGTVRGYASTFGPPPDSYGDIVMPGAFAKTIAKHKAAQTAPVMLWNHRSGDVPIGTWTELREDQTGLYVEGRLNLEVGRAREVLSALRSKSTAGLSIGFRAAPGGRKATGNGTYELREVDLVEISLVNFPANARARVTGAKSMRLSSRIASASAEIRNMNFDS